MKKIFITLITAFFITLSVANAQNSARNANRRTAIRYLQLARSSATEKNWENVKSSCDMGLHYDDEIADLWYLKAVAESHTDGKKSEIIELVTKSLTEGTWVDYNKDGARILYADMLCSTGKEELVFSVLDASPMLYSSDAEFIRAKAYYKMGDEHSVQKARDRIDTARKIYPFDTRFPKLFFNFEYKISRLYEKNSSNEDFLPENARTIADYFINMTGKYKNPDVELEIYSAIFALGEKKTRLLKSFNARGLKHILYAKAALECGLMTQEKALDYFLEFCGENKPLDFDNLTDFIPLITEEDSKKYLSEVLNAYNGEILFDTDGDLVANMRAMYQRGRVNEVTYDEFQDDEIEWKAECDFGVPVKIDINIENLEIEYGIWPSIEKAVFKGGNNQSVTFNVMAENLKWTPFREEIVPVIKSTLDLDFYIPVISDKKLIEPEDLIKVCSNYELPSNERRNSVINVTVLNGVPQSAVYSVDGAVYAQTNFANGLPVSRVVDIDGDGLFETTEIYGFDKEQKGSFQSKEDEMQVMENLFGMKGLGTGFYVKSITIDKNGDTRIDFSEEYFENGGKVSSWDENFDGSWDVRYIKHSDDGSGILKEDSIFYLPLQDKIVSVYSEDGEPKSVKIGDLEVNVEKDSQGIFWYGEKASEENSIFVKNYVNQNDVSGVCNIVENGEERFLVVRAGKYIVAQKL